MHVEKVSAGGLSVHIEASTLAQPAACPACGTSSGRVHSGYQRRLLDTAVGGRQMLIVLRVRRLFCDAGDCPKRTFAEQVPGLTVRYGRRSPVLTRVLQAVGLALGGRPGARLVERLAGTVSRMTLLRLVRSLPDPEQATPRVLGVDDFALRRGHVYGTILVDMHSRRPIELLADRAAETLRSWLQAHPGVEIVCRDRAGAYAEGAAHGAPDAVQVADRWHVWNNLAGAVERTVARHQQCLHAAVVPTATTPGMQASTAGELTGGADGNDQQEYAGPPGALIGPADRTDRVAVRTRARHTAVHALLEQGLGIRTIAARLGLARGTVRRFARATMPDELLGATAPAAAPAC